MSNLNPTQNATNGWSVGGNDVPISDGRVKTYPNYASLPTPKDIGVGVAQTADTGDLYKSNGKIWEKFTKSTVQSKLKEALQRKSVDKVMSNPPIITGIGSDLYPGSWTPALNNDEYVPLIPDINFPSVTSQYYTVSSPDNLQAASVSGGLVGAISQSALSTGAGPLFVRFLTDANYFGIKFYGNTEFNLYCDGELCKQYDIYQTVSGSTPHVVTVRHTTERKLREYLLVVVSCTYFGGIIKNIYDTLSKPKKDRLKIYSETDSYGHFTSSLIARWIDADWNGHAGAGGAGYVTDNASSYINTFTPVSVVRLNNIVTITAPSDWAGKVDAWVELTGCGATFNGIYRILTATSNNRVLTFSQAGANETGVNGTVKWLYSSAAKRIDEATLRAYGGKADIIDISLGINDNSLDLEPKLSELYSYFANLRTALPNSLFIITGPWLPNESNLALYTTNRLTPIKNALIASGGQYIFLNNFIDSFETSWGASGTLTNKTWQTGTAMLGDARANTSMARASNVVTVGSTSHGFSVGNTVVISSNSSFDGVFTIASVPNANSFTYAQTGLDESYPSYTLNAGNSFRINTPGTGNMQLYSGGDGTHVNKNGIKYLALRKLALIEAALATY